jgi:hypothetical protein
MAPAALDPKLFTVRPDPFDQADHLYTPPLLSLPPRCLPDEYHRVLKKNSKKFRKVIPFHTATICSILWTMF